MKQIYLFFFENRLHNFIEILQFYGCGIRFKADKISVYIHFLTDHSQIKQIAQKLLNKSFCDTDQTHIMMPNFFLYKLSYFSIFDKRIQALLPHTIFFFQIALLALYNTELVKSESFLKDKWQWRIVQLIASWSVQDDPAKRTPKQFLSSENLINFQSLKRALLKEFRKKISSVQVHATCCEIDVRDTMKRIYGMKKCMQNNQRRSWFVYDANSIEDQNQNWKFMRKWKPKLVKRNCVGKKIKTHEEKDRVWIKKVV